MKKKIISLLEFIAKKIVIIIERVHNRVLHNDKKISKIEYELKKEYLKNIQPYSSVQFYQSYPPLHIRGARSTLNRYKIYNLENYINKKSKILDIGGNTGFFSLFIANKVKEVDVLEIERSFIDICNKLKKYEKIENLNTYYQDFKKFNPEKKYDLIFSFAVHKHTKMKFENYIDKLFSHLEKDGIILIESHPIDYNKEDELKKNLLKLNNIKIIDKGVVEDGGVVRNFFYIKLKK